jgi:CheY-like chemotaxis protein
LITSHRILVVDDDETIRDSLVEFLADSGYDAVGAVNGRDALDKLEAPNPRPCMIVLDLMMPVMDGKAFRDEQLRDPVVSSIPVVVISAYKDVTTRAEELSATAHLKKPLKLSELLALVRQHCPLLAP